MRICVPTFFSPFACVYIWKDDKLYLSPEVYPTIKATADNGLEKIYVIVEYTYPTRGVTRHPQKLTRVSGIYPQTDPPKQRHGWHPPTNQPRGFLAGAEPCLLLPPTHTWLLRHQVRHEKERRFFGFTMVIHPPSSSRNGFHAAAMRWMQTIGHQIYLVVMFVDNSVVELIYSI